MLKGVINSLLSTHTFWDLNLTWTAGLHRSCFGRLEQAGGGLTRRLSPRGPAGQELSHKSLPGFCLRRKECTSFLLESIWRSPSQPCQPFVLLVPFRKPNFLDLFSLTNPAEAKSRSPRYRPLTSPVSAPALN